MMHASIGRSSALVPLSLSDLEAFDDEPRVRDVRVGEALGFEQARDVRKLIERNLEEIEGFGLARHRGAPISSGKGRITEVQEYWLNEPQALLVCMFARTAKAAEVRRRIIDVFMNWRHARLESPKTTENSIELSLADRIYGATKIANSLANRADPTCQAEHRRVFEQALAWAFKRLGPMKKPAQPCATPQTNKFALPDRDVLADFFEERVIFQKGRKVTARAMFEAYVEWAEREGLDPMTETSFGRRAEAFCPKSMGRVRFYLDCRLIASSSSPAIKGRLS